MAILTQLLTGKTSLRTKLQSLDGKNDLIEFDAIISMSDDYEAEVTQHPVELGADISDHIKVKNIRFRMEGAVSKTPLTLENSLKGLLTSAGSALGSKLGGPLGGTIGAAGAGLAASFLGNTADKSKTSKDILISILQSKKLFRVSTPRFELKSMVMTSITFPRDQQTGEMLRFSAQMQQVQLVKAKLVRLDNVDPAVLHTASASGDLGKQNSGALSAEEDSKGASILSSLTGLK